jgi:hypothetical protein
MKYVYILLALICLSTTSTFAQVYDNDFRESVQFGIKAGANYSNVYDAEGEEFVDEAKLGLAAGIFVAIPIGMYFGIQPEVLFSQKGFKAEGVLFNTTYTFTRTSNYLDIPLMVSVKPSKFFSIMAGPQYSYLLSQKNKFDNSQTSIEQEDAFDNENLRKNMFCFVGGIDINVSQFVIAGRVGWDLYRNNGDGTTTTPRYKNVWYQLALGYHF